MALAPFGALVLPTAMNDATLVETAEQVTRALEAAGVDVLVDDRDERPGVKFKDADLVGIPVRITLGPRSLKKGCVEIKPRNAAEATEVPVAEAAGRVAEMVRGR